MSKPSVCVERVGKKFGLSLKSALKYGLVDSFRRGCGRGKGTDLRPGEFWALKDVDFRLEPGDALGIMGINGSGKTTLLRILNATYTPDRGKVTLRGRIGALIAAGAGFSPMLTGRENVFISGSLLGMSTAEVRSRFDEIVDFAELEEFIDMPVRNYSSGMSVRLGFAVAVLGSPDILLVDEVLAVGDINFQKKCFERIYAIQKEGTTILLVSHSPGAIWAVCNKGLVLHRGGTDGVVNTEDACRAYDHYNYLARTSSNNAAQPKKIASTYDSLRCGTGDAEILSFELLDAIDDTPISSIMYGKSFKIKMHIRSEIEINDALVRFSIDSEVYKCVCIIDSYEATKQLPTIPRGDSNVIVTIHNPNLRPGVYSFTAALGRKGLGVHIFLEHNIKSISVIHDSDMFLYADFRSIFHLNSSFEYLEGRP